MAGLYGPDRHPARFLSGKKNLKNGDAPVNLIHRDDCIAIISQIIEGTISGEIFNCCSDGHPSRKEFYTKASIVAKLPPPHFLEENTFSFKIVSNKKLKQKLNYSFIHPDPMTSI